jgi:peptide/nickel transport system permease protein
MAIVCRGPLWAAPGTGATEVTTVTLWLINRIVGGVVVLWAVSTIVFVLTHVFTNPARAALGLEATSQQVDHLRMTLGLDRPLLSQYWSFISGLPTLQLGDSYWQGVPAAPIVFDRIPYTLELVGTAFAMSFVGSVILGGIAAHRAGGWLDRTIVTVGLLGVSAPSFWVAYLLIIVFAINLGWLPSTGASGVDSVVLPAASMAVYSMGRLTQFFRQAIVTGLRQPYVLTIESRGFGTGYAIAHHVVRNILADFLTVSGWEVVRMIAGSTVVVEVIFGWPGVGLLLVQAIEQRDLVLLQAVVLVIAAMIVLMNLLIDLGRRLVDPRLVQAT